MKTYVGKRVDGECSVHVHEDVPGESLSYKLPARNDLRSHSSTGFQWGYGGSGPAQLALAILADLLKAGDPLVLRHYQDLKWKLIAPLKEDEFTLTEAQVRATLGELEQVAS